GKEYRVGMLNGLAPGDFGQHARGFGDGAGKQGPALRPRHQPNRKVEPPRQTVPGVACPGKSHFFAVDRVQKPGQQARQRRGTEYDQLDLGLSHGLGEPTCGNESPKNTRLWVAFRLFRIIQSQPFPGAGSKCLGSMIFWSIVIAITVITCAALLYAAAGRTVNATAPQSVDENSHFRQLLAGIEADRASGKIGEAE